MDSATPKGVANHGLRNHNLGIYVTPLKYVGSLTTTKVPNRIFPAESTRSIAIIIYFYLDLCFKLNKL
jgi:hypothetical protein